MTGRHSRHSLDSLPAPRVAERAAALLRRPGAWLAAEGQGYQVRLGSDARRRPLMRLDEAGFVQLAREPGLALRPEGGWRLTRDRVAAWPHVEKRPPPGFIAGERAVVTPEGRTEMRRVNRGESPLAWLARRKGPDGQPWLSPAELMAGERLREDFQRAGTLGRLTMAWDAGPQAKGGRGPGMDPLEHGASARVRVRAALNAVGPRFSPVLEQVCLRGSGLGVAERELNLPRRAGKTVLKLALQRLAAHYRIG